MGFHGMVGQDVYFSKSAFVLWNICPLYIRVSLDIREIVMEMVSIELRNFLRIERKYLFLHNLRCFVFSQDIVRKRAEVTKVERSGWHLFVAYLLSCFSILTNCTVNCLLLGEDCISVIGL